MINHNQIGIAQLLILILIFVGLLVGVFLVQNKQIFKSKAAYNPIMEAFEITDSSGNPANCVLDNSNNTIACDIHTTEVNYKLKSTDALIKSE